MGRKTIGSGKSYSRETFKKAVKTGCAIRTSRGTSVKPRQMHRDNLADWVLEEDASAVNETKGTITDPRKLVPFRGRCYGTIVQTLLSRLKASEVKGMTGKFTKDFSLIRSWSGKRSKTADAVAVSPWILGASLFAMACKSDPELKGRLIKRKSTRPGVNAKNRVLDPLAKFLDNITTIQRTGGERAYAQPLMDSLYAIDSRFVKVKGKPEVEVRIAIGRSEPQKSGIREYNAAEKAAKKAAKAA